MARTEFGTEFLHFDESEDHYATDVRVDAIDMLVDLEERGTKVVLRSGKEFTTPERIGHVKYRLARVL